MATSASNRKAVIAAGDKTFYVDVADYEVVNQFPWYIDNGYVARSVYKEGKKYKLLLHRWMLNAPDDHFVEFRDGNPLNCTRGNLRVTRSISKGLKKAGTKSRFKGVTQKGKRYVAAIRVQGHLHHLGYFDLDTDAARAYDAAALEHFGKFAKTNASLGLFKKRKAA
jgi:hypothetical protein